MTRDDGGSAFPLFFPAMKNNSGHVTRPHDEREGMSLRDYFAAKVMQAIYAGPGAHDVANRDRRYDETNWSEVVASNAYAMADAMLRARKAER